MHLLFMHNLNQTTILEISEPFWTLAVEFQFYAAYPLLLFLRRKIGMQRAFLISAFLCLIDSALAHQSWIAPFRSALPPVMFWVQ